MIRVGFSTATGTWMFLAKIIRWFMRRPYSHCWIVLDGEDAIMGVPMVLEESEHGGLHFVPFEGYGVGKEIVKIVEPPRPMQAGVTALLWRMGYTYDYGGLIGEGYVLTMKRFFKRVVKNPLRNPTSMWCSEAVAYALEKAGYTMPESGWEYATPADVDDILAGKCSST